MQNKASIPTLGHFLPATCSGLAKLGPVLRLLPVLALGACSVAAPITRSNEQARTSTITYYNRDLDVSMRLYGDYVLNLRPRNRPDSFTKTQLGQLGVARRQATVVVTGRTKIPPTYELRVLKLTATPDWATHGFAPVLGGRFQRSSTLGTTLVREYAVPQASGWLYVLATGAEEPEMPLPERTANMDAEFLTFSFPSIQEGRQP